MSKCSICQNESSISKKRSHDAFYVDCPLCGKYEITGLAKAIKLFEEEKIYLLIAVLRNSWETGQILSVNTSNWKTYIDSVSIKKDPIEKIERLILYLFKKLEDNPSEYYKFNPVYDYPLLYAQNQEEFLYYYNKVLELGYLEKKSDFNVRLSLPGWKKVSELKTKIKDSNQAFVAMWFDDELNEVWANGFKIA